MPAHPPALHRRYQPGPALRRCLAAFALPCLAAGLALGCGGKAATGNNPAITGFSPTNGPAGTSVTLTGSGFSVGINSVTIGSVTVAPGSVAGDTSLTLTIPTTAVTGPFTVNTTGGSYTTVANFSVTPVISAISPTSAVTGTPLTVTGTGLAGVSQVQFGNALAVPDATQTTANSLVVTVPTGAPVGAQMIIFQNPYGLPYTSANFTVTN